MPEPQGAWATACSAVFIRENSITGTAARLVADRYDPERELSIAIAVIAGAVPGSQCGAGKLSPGKMEKVPGLAPVIAVILPGRKAWLLI